MTFISMASCSNTCAAQLTTSGLGVQFVSPWKPRDKHKTQTLVKLPSQKANQLKLQAKLAALLAEKLNSEHKTTNEDLHNTLLTPPLPDEQMSADAAKDLFTFHDDNGPLDIDPQAQ
ncbi:hypothetical protein BDR04DRAFT_1160883 [Suillus decipiens]|nr:hypothetical protein BDR04DRAFT_1160883 [Suillus decipiens]